MARSSLIDSETFFKVHRELAEVFGNMGGHELDMASLHRADPLFRYEIAKNARLLFGSPADFEDFKTHSFVQYHDTRDLRTLEKILIEKYQRHLNKKYSAAKH